ncbi:MAG: hypothetical protein D6B26_08020 [Spirochaetaceae bacterium]|nr:MAG: hypothetical protein D6B26_08020 [Spirochaetaceae bacterium]
MMTLRRKALLTILLTLTIMIVAAGPVMAQAARRTLLLRSISPESTFTGEQQQIILESLLLNLQKQVAETDFVLPLNTEEEADLNRQAIINGADTVLEVSISGSMEAVNMDFRLTDVFEEAETARFSLSGKIDSRYRNIFGGFWYPAIEQLREVLVPIQNTAILSITALPGSRILISQADNQEEAIEMIAPPAEESAEDTAANTPVQIELAVPAQYRMQSTLRNHFPVRRDLFLAEDANLDITPEQAPRNRWFLQTGLQMLSFPVFSAGYMWDESRLALHGGFTTYLIGIQPFSEYSNHEGDEDPSLFLSLPLSTAEIGVSYRLEKWSNPLNLYPYAGFSVGLRILSVNGIIIDPLVPVEFTPALGVSWRLSRRIELIAGASAAFQLSADQEFTERLDTREALATKITPWLFANPNIVSPHIQVRIGW